MAPATILIDFRKKNNYNFQRWYYCETKRCWTFLHVAGAEFGNVFIPDSYTAFFRKVFSVSQPKAGGGPGSAGTMQPSLHHVRKHEKAFTITVTRTWKEPISFKPLILDETGKKRTQFILLDAEGMLAFMETLPVYVEEVIPCLMDEMCGSEEVSTLSEYSTFTTTSQVRGTCVLKEFELQSKNQKDASRLDLSLVQFTNTSFGLDLRYNVDGQPAVGAYMSSTLLDWLMDERHKIVKAATEFEMGGAWSRVDLKRKMEEADAALCKAAETPVHSPDSNGSSTSAGEFEGGTAKKRAQLVPADPADRSGDITSAPAFVMTAEQRQAFAAQMDDALGDARVGA